MKLAAPLLCILLLSVVVSCGVPAAAPTPDVEATVSSALAATSTAQAGLQQTVNAAVQGTQSAASTPALSPTPDTQATIEAAVRATLAAAPTPTPSTAYVALSEEELAALVDAAVSEATAASAESSAAVTEASADDALTAEEIEELLLLVDETEQAVAYAEELLAAYESLYGDLATETLAVLEAMEEDLAIIAANTQAMAETLETMATALQQGLTLAEEAIAQLDSTAHAVEQKALELQQQAQAWIAQLPAALERRGAAALAVQPVDVPVDRAAALQSAFAYVDAVRQGLADDKLTAAELANIAQRGANASAGLQSHGGPALQGAAGALNRITEQLARGQVPQAKAGLSALESALGPRPARPR